MASSSGATPGRRLITRVEELRRTRPDRAWRELEKTFPRAARGAVPAERGELWRLRGHVLRSLRRAADAARAYRTAERWYRRAGETREVGRCAIGLVDALLYLGRYREARRAAARGRRLLRAVRDSVSLGRLLNNEANVLHRLDRPAEALALYRQARRALERAGDAATARRYGTNVANCLSLLGRLREARQNYDEAERAALRDGQPLDAIRAAYNRAYLEFLDLRHETALRELEAVGRESAAHHYPSLAALSRLDRAEILLHLGDSDAARREGAAAAEACRGLGLRYECAKAETFTALAEYRMGLEVQAARRLETAITAFDAEGNRVWLGEALVGLATLWWKGRNRLAAAALLNAALHHFSAARDREREGCALALLVRVSVGAGRGAAGRRALARLERIVRRQRSPRLLQLALGARAALALASRDRAGARGALRRAAREAERLAARILDEQWRASFWGEWGWPHAALAALELDAGRPIAALEALEAGRGRTLLGAEPSIRSASLRRRVRAWAAGRHARERQRVARSGVPAAFAPPPPGPSGLARTLARRAPVAVRAGHVRSSLGDDTLLLDFLIHEDRVGLLAVDRHAVRGIAGLATETRVASLVHEMLFSLRSAAFQPAAERRPEDGREALERLASLVLWPALESRLLPRAIAVVPAGVLARVPWAALPLPDGRCLIEACEVVVIPGLRLGLAGSSARTPTGPPLVVAVDAGGLDHVAAETRAILGRFPEAQVLEGAEATSQRFLDLAPAAPWIHFAGHGIYDPEAPQLSGLRFADRWLSVEALGAIRLVARRVTLSACQTARALVRPGEEWFGLPRTLLLAGAGTVIASQWDVDDHSARRWMESFYERSATGIPDGEAIRRVQTDLCRSGLHPLDWAGFVRLGGPAPEAVQPRVPATGGRADVLEFTSARSRAPVGVERS